METYQKTATYDAKKGEVKKIVLLYSGSLSTMLLIPWLKKNYKAEVITLLIDLGQKDDFAMLNEKAKEYGAVKAINIDAKETFVQQYIVKAIKANATYQQYHLGEPMAMTLSGTLAVQIAQEEGAGAIAHACAPQSNDQIRLDAAILTLNPDMKIIAPFRDGRLSRQNIVSLAEAYNVTHAIINNPYTYDENLWGSGTLGGALDSKTRPPFLEQLLSVTTMPTVAQNTPEQITIDFQQGIPIKLNGKILPLQTIITELILIGGKHGVGLTYALKDSILGLKTRMIEEQPAARILITAHQALENYVCSREENLFKEPIHTKWAQLCYDGRWFEPLMEDCDAFIDKINRKVNGRVTVQLYKGNVDIVSIETLKNILEQKLGDLMGSGIINYRATAGYIELSTLPMQLAHQDKRNILLTIGTRSNKLKLIPILRNLDTNICRLYATYKTHKFLLKHGIQSILVHKISQKHLQPNMRDLLNRNRFDIIIRILTSKKPTASEKIAADFISEKAREYNMKLITTLDEAVTILEKFRV